MPRSLFEVELSDRVRSEDILDLNDQHYHGRVLHGPTLCRHGTAREHGNANGHRPESVEQCEQPFPCWARPHAASRSLQSVKRQMQLGYSPGPGRTCAHGPCIAITSPEIAKKWQKKRQARMRSAARLLRGRRPKRGRSQGRRLCRAPSSRRSFEATEVGRRTQSSRSSVETQ